MYTCTKEKALASTGFLTESNKSSKLCDAIHAKQCVTRNKGIGRDKGMMIQSEHKYICIGAYLSRGKRGVESTHYSMKAVSVQIRNILQKHLSGVENSFREFASLVENDMMEEAIQLIKPPLFPAGLKDVEYSVSSIHKQQHRKSSIYKAIATRKNVYLNIHCDKDFFICVSSFHFAKQYNVDEASVLYFDFPRLGIYIPLRPGDISFF